MGGKERRDWHGFATELQGRLCILQHSVIICTNCMNKAILQLKQG